MLRTEPLPLLQRGRNAAIERFEVAAATAKAAAAKIGIVRFVFFRGSRLMRLQLRGVCPQERYRVCVYGMYAFIFACLVYLVLSRGIS